MSYLTVIHQSNLTLDQRGVLEEALAGDWFALPNHYRVRHTQPLARASLEALRRQTGLDINTLPADFAPQRVRLLVSDMDSTLITIECIDELADRAGCKAEVAAITAAAMRGELDFATALRRRVALLEGLAASELERVYVECLRFSPGAEQLVAAARRAGLETAVVSGGFTYFTARVQATLGLDHALANELEIRAGRLTGRLRGALVGAEAKAQFLLDLCTRLGITPQQCIAVGDGANDALMLAQAGLGVAYHGKPLLKAQADAVIERGGLERVADFFGETP